MILFIGLKGGDYDLRIHHGRGWSYISIDGRFGDVRRSHHYSDHHRIVSVNHSRANRGNFLRQEIEISFNRTERFDNDIYVKPFCFSLSGVTVYEG